ncbi:Hint domain-containing protein [Ponticoccus sp. SC2-23]|uniref:Hint domain-containing protein n=1 Tax=Alexandriicola marinus TaxID=2081710 RepID=UPI000FD86CC4|nr:Hint domain-containing protein [Alexandriicola marinus]MBM1220638.1 Hint domain-containing protein [Ponticoccus sp. SC6-9]MBM1225324.1 Hint domain-containing protein [Ponticoccus sp. SC6-15]MBM1228838.1 Hint domain-containing protein [Ponticoccus sp. SC6-38]MBM1233525.1 Hint domain-containing protein [Ponticoccus sp. SC6-45]MBM1239339.1 Hint domain-containing protein [Ponticoccus sp. SC6-49]MBM1243121.1 Hint domain-containing protein [Ponticoccus sp. SC2-64]MBM1247049.1 Hint domain-contai
MAIYTDQFYVMDPGNPPPVGTPLTVETFDFEDADDNDLIEPNVGDEFDGSEITSVWVNDQITVVYSDGTSDTITGITYYTADGRAVFTPNDGTILQDSTFVSSTFVTVSTEHDVGDLGPPCFVAGTFIRTARGLLPIEDLVVGDDVWTKDHGPIPIRWRGKRRIAGIGDFAPIRFDAGAFGNPRPLLVSPQHRMLVTGWRAELWFGEEEVLVAAKHLVNGTSIRVTPMRQVEYHHILFDGHEIVESEGILSESFHPGAYIMGTDDVMRNEIFELFPELRAKPETAVPRTARVVLKGSEASVLGAPVLMAA